MYGNLYKEMRANKVTQDVVAKMLGLSNTSMSMKVRGVTDFSSSEMFAIKEKFFPDLTLEYLFEKN